MSGFSEAWLREYQAKQKSRAVRPPAFMPLADIVGTARPDVIAFTLPRTTLLLNVLIRMSWRERSRYRRKLSEEIAGLVPDDPDRAPFQKSKVTIRRFSVGEPDSDALGGAKPLVDALLVRSKIHPDGLGICVDDSSSHMELLVEAVRVKVRKEQRTEVLIENLSDARK